MVLQEGAEVQAQCVSQWASALTSTDLDHLRWEAATPDGGAPGEALQGSENLRAHSLVSPGLNPWCPQAPQQGWRSQAVS